MITSVTFMQCDQCAARVEVGRAQDWVSGSRDLCPSCAITTTAGLLRTRTVELAADAFDANAGDILDRRRGDIDTVTARHAVMYVLRGTGMSYPKIGGFLGRDHTTVMHGVNRFAHRLETEPELNVGLQHIIDRLGQ